MPETEENYFS